MSKRKPEPYRYHPDCHCHRCAIERVVWQKAMRGLKA